MAAFPPLILKTGRINERAAGDSVLLTSAEITGALGYTPLQSPLTTRGDLLTQNPSGTHVRLAIGAAARYLRSDATDPVWAVLDASDLAAGTVPTARLGSGTADSTTFLRGNNTWAVPAGGGTVTGTGTTTRLAEWSSTSAIQASTLIKSGAGVLTLNIGATQTWNITGNNLVIGAGAGGAITSADLVVALGVDAGRVNATGIEWLSIGAFSGYNNTDGDKWAAIGYGAGGGSTTGDEWTTIGAHAGDGNTTGSYWVAIGAYSGRLNATGSDWVTIGAYAGYDNVSGSRNIFIGASAGRSELGSDKLYIEPTNTARPLVGGDFSADTLTLFADDAATNAVRTQLTLDYASSGTPAAGFGNRLMFALESSTTVSQLAASWDALWGTATHASRKARIVGNVYDTAVREWIRGEASGSAAMIGFLGAAAVVRQASGADLTNNVTSGGTNDTIANYTSLSTYSTDAAAIRNNIYQLARKLKQVNDALRLYGLLT